MWPKIIDLKLLILFSVVLIILLAVLAGIIYAITRKMFPEQLNTFFTGVTAFFTVIIAAATVGAAIIVGYAAIVTYQTWKNERILELTNEYDELAKSRKVFWDHLDRVYKVFAISDQLSDQSSEHIRAMELIWGKEQNGKLVKKEVWPCVFNPEKIEEKEGKDLSAAINEIDKKQDTTRDWGELWKFAKFVYPGRGELGLVSFSATFERESFDNARGKLARFWDKWASSSYSREELLRNYRLSAYEQLIMLTWLELALARRSEGRGKGKVELFKLAKKIDEDLQKR